MDAQNLRDLYQEVILDHNKNPRNFHTMENASSHADGFNPLCGDKLSLYLKITDDKITDMSFTGCGCAISTASASLMTEALKGKSIDEATLLFDLFHHWMTQSKTTDTDTDSTTHKLGKLSVMSGVRIFPSRIKCATLAWHTLQAAITNSHEPVSTE